MDVLKPELCYDPEYIAYCNKAAYLAYCEKVLGDTIVEDIPININEMKTLILRKQVKDVYHVELVN